MKLATTVFGLLALLPQTTPTPSELAQWKDPSSQILESSPCKKITWLLEAEKKSGDQGMHHALGWWGRGYVEGAVYMIDGEAGDAARKRVQEFGLSVDVVTAHITTYCYAHPTDTPMEAVQALLLKAMK